MMAARGCDLPDRHFFDGGRTGLGRGARADDSIRLFQRRHLPTLCVRTCDGYYFPISFSTTQDRSPEDERTCQAMCPGTKRGSSSTKSRRRPGEHDGARRAGLFVAADRVPVSQAPTLPAPAAGRFSVAAAVGAEPARPCACRSRAAAAAAPAPGEDPETLANRPGGFVPRPASCRCCCCLRPVAASGSSAPLIGKTRRRTGL